MAYGNIAAIGKCTLGTNVSMTSDVAIMNDSNIVMLCGDMTLTGTHTASDVLFTLPDSAMFPSTTLTMLGVFQPTSGSRTTRVFQVDTSGQFTCTNPTAGTYYLNGFMWHNNSKYYSSAIGNIGGYTSPLSAR